LTTFCVEVLVVLVAVVVGVLDSVVDGLVVVDPVVWAFEPDVLSVGVPEVRPDPLGLTTVIPAEPVGELESVVAGGTPVLVTISVTVRFAWVPVLHAPSASASTTNGTQT